MASLDASLDEIINSKAKQAPKRGGKGGGKGKGGKEKKTGGPVKNTTVKTNIRTSAAPYKAPKPSAGSAGGGLLNRLGGKASSAANGTMVSVSNLPPDVISKDIMELFGTIGEVLSAKIIFKNRKSTGQAQVVFAQQSKAVEAVKQFHSRTLDGVAMEVKIVPRSQQLAMGQDQSREENQTKASLFGSALGGGGGGPRGRGVGRAPGGHEPSFSIVLPKPAPTKAQPKAQSKGAAKPKAAAKPKQQQPKKEPVKAENLDDDLDSYFAANKPSE